MTNLRVPAYVDRMVNEQIDLNEKLGKLRLFIGTQTFNDLPEDERALLNEQEYHMTRYSQILGDRINGAIIRENGQFRS